MSKGVLYIVSRDKELVDECIHSAASLKTHHPALPVQVITDVPSSRFQRKYFDFVDVRPGDLHPLKAKVKYLNESRFESTLFLDADTEVRQPIEQLFSDNKFNLSLTYDNLCDWRSDPVRFIAQESEDFNTGFLMYDSSQAVRELFARWYELLSKQDESDMSPGHNCDQVYFNRHFGEMLKTDGTINLRILPNDLYNVRPWCWQNLKDKGTFGNVKLIHAHHLHHNFLTKAGRKIESFLRARFQIPSFSFSLV